MLRTNYVGEFSDLIKHVCMFAKISNSEGKFTGLSCSGDITRSPKPEICLGEHKTIIRIF